MRLPLLLTLLLLTGAISAGETIYRTDRADGGVVFSDTASDGARPIELNEVPTVQIKALNDSENVIPAVDSSARGEASGATISIDLLSPGNDETVWHSGEGVVVTVAVKPQLPAAAKLVVTIDGEDVASQHAEQINVGIVHRGSHTLAVRLVSESGRVIATTSSTTFHVRQHSRINRKRLEEEDASEQ